MRSNLKTFYDGSPNNDYCSSQINDNEYRSLFVDNNNNIIVCDRSGLYLIIQFKYQTKQLNNLSLLNLLINCQKLK
jgi:hypothetical protein